MSSGISANLLKQIQNTLLTCGPFQNQETLAATFIDSRISIWRQALPEANSVMSRVTEVIDFLLDKHNSKGDNALVLLLQVLSGQLDEGDSCHHQLLQLANVLKKERENLDLTPTAAKQPFVAENPKPGMSVSTEGDISGQVALGSNIVQIGEVHDGSITIQLGKTGSATTSPTPEEN